MSFEQLPALQVMVPLLGAPLCVLVRHARTCWVIATLATLGCALIAWQLLGMTADGAVVRYAIGGWAAPAGIEYYIDTLNASILLVVSGISAVALVYARTSIEDTVGADRLYFFYAAWLLCLTGLLGIVATGDAFNVFVFLEVASLSSYMLVAFGSDKRAFTASFRYLIMGSIGASFILIGIGYLYAATGTLNMVDLHQRIPDSEAQRSVLVAFTFLTIGLMIKAAIFPLHGWLMNSYQHAPIAVTVFLAGTSTKVSLYVLMRFFYSIFGVEYSFGQMLLSSVLLPAAAIAFVVMSLVAVYQTDLRRMLAFSSVAQIGYIVAGIGLATQAGLAAGIVHIFHHAIIKAALFMAVGCILYRVGHVHVPSLQNLVKRMPFTTAAFLIAGFGLIGVPLTAGFVSKFALIAAVLDEGWWILAALILFSSLLAVVYVGRVIEIMVFRRPRTPESSATGLREAPLMMLVPLYFLVGLSVWFGVQGSLTLSLADAAAASLLGGYQ